MSEQRLPEPFQDLEPFLGWALATEAERSARRQASSFAEIKVFYDAMLARIEALLTYLDQYSPDAVPADVQRLFFLTLSLAEVSPAVEFFGQASVVDGYDAARFISVGVFPDGGQR